MNDTCFSCGGLQCPNPFDAGGLRDVRHGGEEPQRRVEHFMIVHDAATTSVGTTASGESLQEQRAHGLGATTHFREWGCLSLRRCSFRQDHLVHTTNINERIFGGFHMLEKRDRASIVPMSRKERRTSTSTSEQPSSPTSMLWNADISRQVHFHDTFKGRMSKITGNTTATTLSSSNGDDDIL